MDFLDRIARSKEQAASDLAAFITESPSEPEIKDLPLQELSQFPAEQAVPAVGSALRTGRRNLPGFRLLTAAVLAAAVSSAWWGGFIQHAGAVAADAMMRAATRPIADGASVAVESSPPPAELVATMDVRPSAKLPIARVHPTVALADVVEAASAAQIPSAFASAAPDRRLPFDRPASTPRGPTGAERSAPLQRLAPQQPLATTPASEMAATTAANVIAQLPVLEPAPATAPSESPQQGMPIAPAARAAPEALPPVVARSEQSEIQRTLGQYRSAYQLLDADAARAVWPSVDVRALARAFDTLTSQQLAFESCQFNIAGEAATAECRGSATYIPKVGNREPKLEARQWTFHLRKVEDRWKIQSAQTRR